jgi:hypothetical protein
MLRPDEYTLPLTVDEPEIQQAIWSPSGVADTGGCMLAVLSNRGGVSVYAPVRDPATNPWEEVRKIAGASSGQTVGGLTSADCGSDGLNPAIRL